VGLQLLRYVNLASPAEPDPLTQPGPDAYGPRAASLGGRVLCNAWLVDGLGRPLDGSAVDVTLAICTWSNLPEGPGPSGPVPAETGAWGRGNPLVSTAAGIWYTQAQLGPGASFAVAVTAIVAPLTGFLAIYADVVPSGRVP
jgi:hypothetical protein